MKLQIFAILLIFLSIFAQIQGQDDDVERVIEEEAKRYSQSKMDNSDQSSDEEGISEEDYVLETIIDDEYLKPRDYNYGKENIWKKNCKKDRMAYLKTSKYRQRQNYIYLQDKPKSYYDYKFSFIQDYGNKSDYTYGKKIGSGHYAEVFLGTNNRTNETVILKNLNSIKIDKIKREYQILQQMKDGPNIVKLVDIYPLVNNSNHMQVENQRYVFNTTKSGPKKAIDEDGEEYTETIITKAHLKKPFVKRKTARAAYVFDFITTQTVHKSEKYLLDLDIRCMMYDSLKAVAYIHSKGVMHRDLKPGNIVYHMAKKQTKVIDFGLADYFHLSKPYHYRVATKTYKPPELLLNYTCYDYNIDTWGLGVTFGQLLFKKRPLFPGKEDIQILKQQVKQFGTDKLLKLIKKLNIKVDHFTASQFQSETKPRNWGFYKKPKNAKNFSPEAIDLLDKLLQFDFTQRISPLDALNHAYFDPVRDFKEGRNTTDIFAKNKEAKEEESTEEEEEDESELQKKQDVLKEKDEWFENFQKLNPDLNLQDYMEAQKVHEENLKNGDGGEAEIPKVERPRRKNQEQQEQQQQEEQNDNQEEKKSDL